MTTTEQKLSTSRTLSATCSLKNLFYLEAVVLLSKKLSLTFYLATNLFNKKRFLVKKLFLLFLSAKLLLDPFLFVLPTEARSRKPATNTQIIKQEPPTIKQKPKQKKSRRLTKNHVKKTLKAQTWDFVSNEEDDFNLVTVESKPVSIDVSISPGAIIASSLPVSFLTNEAKAALTISSLPVSFTTDPLKAALTISSDPVSYSIERAADLLKVSSLPVSYSLTSFVGALLTARSSPVSFKTYNGVPILSSVSPNLLPLSQDARQINVTVTGENFSLFAKTFIGTIKIDTKYISSKELLATIPANYLKKEQSFEVLVANPPPDGGVSKGLFVRVVDPVPIAKINATPSVGFAPQIITFDATSTEDILARYFGQESQYEWDFGVMIDDCEMLNENAECEMSNNAVSTFKYETPGKYTVSLSVTNAYGKTDKTTKQIEIRDKNEAPLGTFEISKTYGFCPFRFFFS